MEAQFLTALILFEWAHTFPSESSEAEQQLQRAEEAFGVVADKYRRRVAGLSAVLFQGRCRQDRGDVRGALGFFEELLTLPDDEPSLRSLKTKALCHAMDCWLHPELQQVEQAIAQGQQRLERQRPDEQDDPDWLTLRLRLAEAYLQLASSDAGARDRSRLQADARRLAVEVAKYPGESQKAAQELLAESGQAITLPTSQVQATTFAEALQAGQEILEQRQVAAGTIALLGDRLSHITDPDQRKEAENRLRTAREQLEQSDQKALQIFDQARLLADDETPLEQLNLVRFYLCTLHYYAKNYGDSAVLAGFLSRHFPDSAEGRRAGSVALASLVQLYGDGSLPAATSLTQQIRRTAEDLARRYAGQPEAEDALGTLVTLSIQDGHFDEAEQYLAQLPEDSSKRGPAELAAGQALWNRSFADSAENESAATAEASETLRVRATQLLDDGLRHSQGQPATPAMVAAALSLAQRALQQDQPRQALELLEHPTYGPRALAMAQDPLMQSPARMQRAYTLALLAYVATLPQAADPDETVAQAMATLETLRGTYGKDAAGQRQLAATYVALAQNVRKQIEAAPPAGRRNLSAAFAQFLERAAASATEVDVLNWVAESYLGLGRALVNAEGQLTAEGIRFVDKAIAIYRSILERSAAGQLALDANARWITESRLGTAYREAGKFAEARDEFAKILAQRPNQVYLQMEAARLLQQWGDQGRAEAYREAIQGTDLDPVSQTNRIWGYGRLARIVARKASLRDLFHECRFRLAQCRYAYALQQPQNEQGTTLAAAEQDILRTALVYPDLGGPEQKAQYDALLQEIQKSRGKKPTGLP